MPTQPAGGDGLPPVAEEVKGWHLDEHMDKSVRPGDDFFMYCNGGRYARANYEQGLIQEAYRASAERVANLDDATLNKVEQDALMADDRAAEAVEAVRVTMAGLVGVSSAEEAWRMAGRLILKGFDDIFSLDFFETNGTVSILRTMDFDNSREMDASFLTYCLQVCGRDESEAADTAQRGAELRRYFREWLNNLSSASAAKRDVGAASGAELWRDKYSPGNAMAWRETDVISLSRERVNDTTMNCERWLNCSMCSPAILCTSLPSGGREFGDAHKNEPYISPTEKFTY